MQLIITEKPLDQMNINKALANITADGICNVHLFYKFNYEGFNFPSKPRYQHDKKSTFTYKMYHHQNGSFLSGQPFNFHENQNEKFLKYSEICLFIDSDHSGVRCSDLFLNHFFGSIQDQYPITFVVVESSHDEHIKNIYENRLDFFKKPITKKEKNIHNKIDKYRKEYEVKDYIDFNFNGLMKQLFPSGNLLMTRNKIMILLLLKDLTFTDSIQAEKSIMKLMNQHNIGGPASKSEMIRTLIDAEFISPKLYTVTKEGRSFIDNLPMNLKNFESLKRLQDIDKTALTHEQKMVEIEIYLKSLFELS